MLWHGHFKPFLTITVHLTFHGSFVWNMYHKSQIYLAEPCIASMSPCLYSCWHLTKTSQFCPVVYIQKVSQEFICKVCPLPLPYFVLGTPKWIFNWKVKEKIRLSSTYFLLGNFKNGFFSCTLPLFFFQTFFMSPVSCLKHLCIAWTKGLLAENMKKSYKKVLSPYSPFQVPWEACWCAWEALRHPHPSFHELSWVSVWDTDFPARFPPLGLRNWAIHLFLSMLLITVADMHVHCQKWTLTLCSNL